MVDTLPETRQANREAVRNVSENKHIAISSNTEDRFVRVVGDGAEVDSEPNAWSKPIHLAFAYEGGDEAREKFRGLTHERKYQIMMALQDRGSYTVTNQDLEEKTLKETLERPIKENGQEYPRYAQQYILRPLNDI